MSSCVSHCGRPQFERIACTLDSCFVPGGESIRFTVQDAAGRQGLVIDVASIRRTLSGCPMIEGFFAHNVLDGPAARTVDQLDFIFSKTGPGMKMGGRSMQHEPAEFAALHNLLKE